MILSASILINQKSFSQSQIIVTVKGLIQGDSALVRIQKSSETYRFKYIAGNGNDISLTFDSLANGPWALGIDAKTYIFPLATTINLNNNTISSTIQLNKTPIDSNFIYNWQDDSSFVGHAQQSYINDKVVINVLGKAEKVPDDFNGIKLLNAYGFLLSDSITKWTSEDAYRLYKNIGLFNFHKYGENDSVLVRAKFFITDDHLDRDIQFTKIKGVDFVTISRDAFTYAAPLVVTLDNVKGNFFSKRLFTSIVYYYTNKGTDQTAISQIANARFGVQFLDPSALLQTVMNETQTNYQSFTPDEKIIILSMLEEYPDAMHQQQQLKYLVRRINGQVDPEYPQAAALARTGRGNIEFMETAFVVANIEPTQRLVLHEKSHFLWAYTFDASTKKDWADLGGWYLDPTAPSGWSTTNTTEFVSAYGHLKNPDEDMAESIAFYITDPDALRSRSIRKFEFIRDRIMQGTTYISIIRPDLTFQVYNLYPNYNYPGKIKRTKLEVIGADTADKTVRLEIELNIQNPKLDGATSAYTRFTSSAGTIADMYLSPTDNTGSVLVGFLSLSKFAKSGYWRIDQIVTTDVVGNQRYESNTNFGLKCFVNNPLEDLTPPLYIQQTLKLDSTSGKFSSFGGSLCNNCPDSIQPMNAVKISFSMAEKNTIAPYGRVLARMIFPTLDSSNKNNIIPYSLDCQIGYEGIQNDVRDSLKNATFYLAVPDYYPSGYYSISYLLMQDLALNIRHVFFDKDTANQNYFLPPALIDQRALRDSVHITTKYPDYLPPMLDLNRMQIKATPTNPTAPNGETIFEMWLWIKDTSDFKSHASGFKDGTYILRDPQGIEHSVSMQGDLGSLFYDITPDSSIYGYKRYYFHTLLPVGSAPGLWGVSSIRLTDHAQNTKYYSFAEIVRFDVELSKILQVNPSIEILGKKVNLLNQDSASVKFGCASCINQNYHLNMYSSMGGNNVVFDGKMTADTITLNNLNLKGVNDGVLYATVMMLDTTQALIGMGKASYTKDTQIPINYRLTTNKKLLGSSNLDSFIVNIKSVEINSTNNIILSQKTINNGYSGGMKIGDSVLIQKSSTDTVAVFSNSSLNNFSDGLIDVKVISVDSVGNPGDAVIQTIYKDTKSPVLSFQKDSMIGLKAYYTLSSNEFIGNKPNTNDFILNNGSVTTITKQTNQLFKIVVDRICNDTLNIQIKDGVLLDTAGNSNTLTGLNLINVVFPSLPAVNNINYCQGANATQLNATVSVGDSLIWYTQSSSGTGSNIAPTPTTTTVGTISYYVSQKNILTACEGPRNTIVVTINALPSVPTIGNNRPLTFCNGDSTILTSSSTNNNQWLLNGTNISAAIAQNITVKTSGVYTVKITNTSGCTAISLKDTITVNALPSVPTISNSRPLTFCNGDSTILTSSAASNNQWLLNGTNISAATTSSYTVKASGNYSVTNTNSNGCSATSTATIVAANSIPSKPTINRDVNNNLVSSLTDGNQWYSGSSVISGATNQLYKPLTDGYYKVQVTLNNCQSSFSDAYYYLVTAIINLSTNESVSIYPNPVANDFWVEYKFLNLANVVAELYDLNGKKVFEKTITSGNRISATNLPNGNYTIRLIDAKANKLLYTGHIIKMK